MPKGLRVSIPIRRMGCLALFLMVCGPLIGSLLHVLVSNHYHALGVSLRSAIRQDDIPAVLDALKEGADPNYYSPDAGGRNIPLIYAAEYTNLKIVRILLEHGANINKPNYAGDTALHHAVRNQNLEMVQLLLDAGADVNAQNYEGFTPLHSACQSGNFDVLIALIQRHPNVNLRAKDSSTPLDCTSDPDMRKPLKAAGAKTGKELDAEKKP